MPTVEVYSQRGCGACDVEIPRIIREAKSLGVDVQVIDIDRCAVNRQSVCDSISYVPTLMYQGKEIGISDLAKIAKQR